MNRRLFGNASDYLFPFRQIKKDPWDKDETLPPEPPQPPGQFASANGEVMPATTGAPTEPPVGGLPPAKYVGQIASLNGYDWVVKPGFMAGEMEWTMAGRSSVPKTPTVKLREFNKRLYRENPDGTLTDMTPEGTSSIEKSKAREDTYTIKGEDGSSREVTYALDKNGGFQTDELGSPIVAREIVVTPPKPEKDKEKRPPNVKYPNPYGATLAPIDIAPEWSASAKSWVYDYETARKQALSDARYADERAAASSDRSADFASGERDIAEKAKTAQEAATQKEKDFQEYRFQLWVQGNPPNPPTFEQWRERKMPKFTPWGGRLPGSTNLYESLREQYFKLPEVSGPTAAFQQRTGGGVELKSTDQPRPFTPNTAGPLLRPEMPETFGGTDVGQPSGWSQASGLDVGNIGEVMTPDQRDNMRLLQTQGAAMGKALLAQQKATDQENENRLAALLQGRERGRRSPFSQLRR